MSHGYLGAQFFSPMTNFRDDEYGARERPAVRARGARRPSGRAPATGVAVGVRLAADEGPTGALGPAACARIARGLCGDGLVDFVDLALGYSATLMGSVGIVPPPPVERNAIAEPAGAVRAALPGVPMIAHHARRQPRRRRAAARRRPGRRDRHDPGDDRRPRPDRQGRARREPTTCSHCIGCNQGCIGHYHAGTPIACVVNPRTGRERRCRVPCRAAPTVTCWSSAAARPASPPPSRRPLRRPRDAARARRRGRRPVAPRRPRARAHRDVGGLRGRRASATWPPPASTCASAPWPPRPTPTAATWSSSPPARGPTARRSPAPALPRGAGVGGDRRPRRGRGAGLVADWGGGYEGLDAAELLRGRGLRGRAGIGGVVPGEDVHQYQRNLYLARLDVAGVRIRHHLELTPTAARCATSSPAARRRSARSQRSSWRRAARPTTSCGARSRAGRASSARATCSVRDRPRRRSSRARSQCGRSADWPVGLFGRGRKMTMALPGGRPGGRRPAVSCVVTRCGSGAAPR